MGDTTLAYRVGEMKPYRVLTIDGNWIEMRVDELEAPYFEHAKWAVFPGDRSEYEYRSYLSSQGIDPDTGAHYGGPHGDFTAEDYDRIMDQLEAEGRVSDVTMEEDPTGRRPEQPEVPPEQLEGSGSWMSAKQCFLQ